jgi:DNA-binding MltR family transcriptional regulator
MGSLYDFVTALGPAGPPATIAASVLALFEIVDRAESKAAKAVVAQQLRSFDIKTAAILPTGTKELFQRVFGKTHFSLKCFFVPLAFLLARSF